MLYCCTAAGMLEAVKGFRRLGAKRLQTKLTTKQKLDDDLTHRIASSTGNARPAEFNKRTDILLPYAKQKSAFFMGTGSSLDRRVWYRDSHFNAHAAKQTVARAIRRERRRKQHRPEIDEFARIPLQVE